MGGVLKKIGGAIVKGVTTVLKSPVLSFAASFIPVVGPFIGIASKIYNGVQALKSGNLLGAATSFLGGTGIGGALNKTLSGVMGKVSGWIGPAGMNFASSAMKALGGNTNDILKIANMASDALKSTQQADAAKQADLQTMVQHNATRLAQYAQAQAYAA
ncbi:MAG: hypothetical protein H6Q89_4663 [Myxococcaceae bacterium]|nr:hypothetical protein [Myxococcaceae bacterium]